MTQPIGFWFRRAHDLVKYETPDSNPHVILRRSIPSCVTRVEDTARPNQYQLDLFLGARCLRKYGGFLRNRGHLQPARDALLEALRLSAHGRGTRQRIYILGCLGDLERQKQNYAAASEHLERAVELARATFIPGWLGNLHLELAELGLDQNRFDDAKIFLEQAEAHCRNTHPRHWWGEIQVGLARSRLLRAAGSQE